MKFNHRNTSSITSVLIPLFNHENFIIYCLDSLLKSNTKKIQLIISDDNSNDNSYTIAKNWVKLHKHLFYSILIVRQKKNLGINANINFLLRKSSGSYITFLASDDALTVGSIDFQKNYLNAHPEINFLFCNQNLFDKNNNIIKFNSVGFRRAFLLKIKNFIILDIIFNWGGPWSVVFARSNSMRQLGNFPISISYNDRWQAFKIIHAGNFAYLNKVSYFYRVRSDNSITPGLEKKKMLFDLLQVELDAIKFAKGTFYTLLFLYTWPLRLKTKNRFLVFLCKLPKKIIKNLYLSMI